MPQLRSTDGRGRADAGEKREGRGEELSRPSVHPSVRPPPLLSLSLSAPDRFSLLSIPLRFPLPVWDGGRERGRDWTGCRVAGNEPGVLFPGLPTATERSAEREGGRHGRRPRPSR